MKQKVSKRSIDGLEMEEFSWKSHSETVKRFHEDIVVSNIKPEHMSMRAYLQLFRSSREHGLPAYARSLRKAYDERKDGMLIWRMGDKVVGWSWLQIHENEFFKEGAYGELNEIYIVSKWRGKGLGKIMMLHAFNWFRERRVSTIRVEVLASNKAAIRFYRKFGFRLDYMSLQTDLSKQYR